VSAKTPFETSPQDAQLWRDAKASFAGAAVNRRLIVADNSSHHIRLDRPDVVIGAIQEFIDKAR
jgi:pimeloyl-ACP methyl ester carboxylesterase